MVRQCNCRSSLKIMTLPVFKDIVPDDRMRPYYFGFFLRQFSRLQKNIVGNSNLSNIMQLRGLTDKILFFFVQSQTLCYQPRVFSNPLLVISCIWIPEFCSLSQ